MPRLYPRLFDFVILKYFSVVNFSCVVVSESITQQLSSMKL